MPPGRKPIPAETWDQVVEHLHAGYNLTEISLMDGMPARATMTQSMVKHPELNERIARARDLGWDARAERIMTEIKEEPDAQWARLKLDANRWLLAKMNPAKYGEKITQEHTGPGGGPISVAVAAGELPGAIAEILKLARDRAEHDGSDLA